MKKKIDLTWKPEKKELVENYAKSRGMAVSEFIRMVMSLVIKRERDMGSV